MSAARSKRCCAHRTRRNTEMEKNGNLFAGKVAFVTGAASGIGRAAALDYAAQNIRVNAVCPGYIDTPMMGRFTGGTPEGRAKVTSEEPIGRMGRPEEIASAVLWLCSDGGAFTVGHALVVDGGQTVQ